MVETNTKETILNPQQANLLGDRLDAAYQYDRQVWERTTEPDTQYKPKKHGNDWGDMQQVIHLCDPGLYLLTADKGIRSRVSKSKQANRVLYLADYLKLNGLNL